jgi:O-acetyl-ADP-ribose deacetylase (regulator of RNase III)
LNSKSYAIGSQTLELVVGDITAQEVDAIGNAASALLVGGGGVDGAIHRAAGPDLLNACLALKKKLPGGVLKTGGAVVTAGFGLTAKHVIHCVGPIYAREGSDAPALLESCYRNALAIAREHRLESVAFPSIATGVYGYPVNLAAPIALGAVFDELAAQPLPRLVRFVLFNDEIFAAYRDAADALRST